MQDRDESHEHMHASQLTAQSFKLTITSSKLKGMGILESTDLLLNQRGSLFCTDKQMEAI
jgi:stress-induced morphogen